jgi:hypothetical protein
MGYRSGVQSQWIGGSLQILPPAVQVLGNAYFVDATNGSNTANSGSSWSDCLATVDAAVAKCTANQGDVIFMAPWHAESGAVAATAVATMDIAGVTLWGVKQGNQRPTFTFTEDDSLFSVTAPNCRVHGIKIISAVIDQAVGLSAGALADGLEVDDCLFTDGAVALELVIGLQLAAACDGCYIHDNQFFTVDGGGCASAIKILGESVRTIIANNVISGDYSVAGIDGATALTTNIVIDGNMIDNLDPTAGLAIGLHANTTGIVTRNLTHGGKNTTAPVSAAACMACENYATTVEAESGNLCPAAGNWAA